MRFEIGPVLRFETRLVARRKGYYALRMAFGLALLAPLAAYHWAFVMNLRQRIAPAMVKSRAEPDREIGSREWSPSAQTERHSARAPLLAEVLAATSSEP
jgi:hypothetical protein